MAEYSAYRAIQVNSRVQHAVARNAPLGRQPALCGVFVTVEFELDNRFPQFNWMFDKMLKRSTQRGGSLWCVPCQKCKKAIRSAE